MSINPKKKYLRLNRQIISPYVRVNQEGQHLGIMSIQQALDLSYQAGLDLVEMVPNANPPVCYIMDYGKYRFEEKKKAKEQQAKSKGIASKELRLRPVSSDHDVDIKIGHLKEWIQEKRQVTVSIRFKNRELMHKEQGFKIAERIVSALEGIAKTEHPPRFEGSGDKGRITLRLSPLK